MNHRFKKYLEQGQVLGSRYTLCTQMRIPAGLAGNLLGKNPGTSLEFMDYREYQQGDDLRRIDWSAYGRTDRLVVKMYRHEVTPHVDVILDGSRSMNLSGSEKSGGAIQLCAALASAAGNASFTHCAWLAGEGVVQIPNSSHPPQTWDEIDFKFRGNLSESFERFFPQFKPRGIRILVSDLLFFADPAGILSRLSANGASVIVIQLLARSDSVPPEHGNLRLVDSETGEIREVFIDTLARNRYIQKLTAIQDSWKIECEKFGAVFKTIIAEELCETSDLYPLVADQILKVK